MQFDITYKNLPPFHKEISIVNEDKLKQPIINLKIEKDKDAGSSAMLSLEDYVLTLQNLFRELRSVQEITTIDEFRLSNFKVLSDSKGDSIYTSAEDAEFGNERYRIVLYDINKNRLKEGVYLTCNNNESMSKKGKKTSLGFINEDVLDSQPDYDSENTVKDSKEIEESVNQKRNVIVKLMIIFGKYVGRGYNFIIDEKNNLVFTHFDKVVDLSTLSDEKYVLFLLVQRLFKFIKNKNRENVFLIDCKDFSVKILSAVLATLKIVFLNYGYMSTIFIYNLSDEKEKELKKEVPFIKNLELPRHIIYTK